MSFPSGFSSGLTTGFTSSMLSQYPGKSFVPYGGAYIPVPTEMLFSAASQPGWKDPALQPAMIQGLILAGNPGSYFKK